MNLYEVTNGFTAYSYVRVLVIAPNEERAKELATKEFKEEAKNEYYEEQLARYKQIGLDSKEVKEFIYPESYWSELEVICLHEDVTKEFVSCAHD